jgi:F420H(2)-dependent quinone reductase
MTAVPQPPPTTDEAAHTSFDPSARMRQQARLMAVANVVMRRLLSLPFPTPLSRRLMLLTVTGRRTGKVYRQPISYVRSGDTLLTPGGGRWTRNLETGRPVSLRLSGKDHPAIPTIIDDLEEVQRHLTVIVTANPAAKKFMPIAVDQQGRPHRDTLMLAVEHGFRIISWRPGAPHDRFR